MTMPEKKTVKRARKAKQEGKAPSSQAGEFVREEIHHVRGGKHGARSAKQAIAIGLSKARRAGVEVPAPGPGEAPEKTRQQAKQALKKGRSGEEPSPTRSRARKKALKSEPRKAASKAALSRQARAAAAKRTKAERSASAKKAAWTRKK
jgi:hypothetical protein